MDECFSLYVPTRDENPEVYGYLFFLNLTFKVILLYGPTGCGKSRWARGLEGVYITPLGGDGWFDGLDGHDNIVLDDFAGAASKTSLNDVLRLLDRYVERVKVKGSFRFWKPKLTVITTNIHPYEWYNWDGREAQYPALQRRFTTVVTWRADGSGRTEIRPTDERLWDKFFHDYARCATSAAPERDPDTGLVRMVSRPGDWRRKFDWFFE